MSLLFPTFPGGPKALCSDTSCSCNSMKDCARNPPKPIVCKVLINVFNVKLRFSDNYVSGFLSNGAAAISESETNNPLLMMLFVAVP